VSLRKRRPFGKASTAALAFDSQEHLDAWRKDGVFPKIHDLMEQGARRWLHGPRVADLCCNIGLLGQRLLERVPQVEAVVGVEMDATAFSRGQAAGIRYPILHAHIIPRTLPTVLAFLAEHRTTSLTARRCLSEVFHLHEPDDWPALFARELRRIGIAEVLLQGRARTPNATHDYPTSDEELAPFVLSGAWKVAERDYDVVYLTPA
jgi:SAM-dependent methyltransferase